MVVLAAGIAEVLQAADTASYASSSTFTSRLIASALILLILAMSTPSNRLKAQALIGQHARKTTDPTLAALIGTADEAAIERAAATLQLVPFEVLEGP